MKKPIIVNLSDGQITDVLNVPPGHTVEIRDYDSPEAQDFNPDKPWSYAGPLKFEKDINGDWYEEVEL